MTRSQVIATPTQRNGLEGGGSISEVHSLLRDRPSLATMATIRRSSSPDLFGHAPLSRANGYPQQGSPEDTLGETPFP